MRILYLMHVPWGWAKQRPHFLAEQLAKQGQQIKIKYLKSYRKSNLKESNPQSFPLSEIFILPLGNKWRIIFWINQILIRWQCRKNSEFDIVWLTSPIFGGIDLRNASACVYDCMDDFVEFPSIQQRGWLKNYYTDLEKRILINKAKLVIFSSQTLSDKILKRYNSQVTSKVVNNALKYPAAQFSSTHNKPEKLQITIVYVGTISSWFDFKTVLAHLDSNSMVKYRLYGPAEVELPSHERLTYYGPIPHSKVVEVLSLADILIMPFIVNQLIESVNPVKLYEYISMNKPIVASRYKESEFFEDYVYLYRDFSDYEDIMGEIESKGFQPKNLPDNNFSFVSRNTWDARGAEILNAINLLGIKNG